MPEPDPSDRELSAARPSPSVHSLDGSGPDALSATRGRRAEGSVSAERPGRRRQFIVARLEKRGECEREQRQVQARSHEEAVAVVAAARTPAERTVVYEVWPATEPAARLRITLDPRESGRLFTT